MNKILNGTGPNTETASRLTGEVYSLVREEPGTVMHDAKEFATLLNSCGRYEKAPTGLEVCIKGPEFKNEKMKALKNLQNHKANLKRSIDMVKAKELIVLDSVQYLRNGENDYLLPIEDTVVGIVAGMLLGSGDIPVDRPLIAFALAADDKGDMTKASARGTKELVERGLDLSWRCAWRPNRWEAPEVVTTSPPAPPSRPGGGRFPGGDRPDRSRSDRLTQHGHYDRLLGVQAVLGLVQDDAPFTVEHLGGDLHAAVGGHAVQNDRIILRQRQQVGVDPVGLEHALPLGRLVLLAHRHPYVGVQHERPGLPASGPP